MVHLKFWDKIIFFSSLFLLDPIKPKFIFGLNTINFFFLFMILKGFNFKYFNNQLVYFFYLVLEDTAIYKIL